MNCIRALPGRGIRISGARTLSRDPAWRYVNVRLLFLTVGRWLEHSPGRRWPLSPHDVLLWARIERELRAYCTALFRAGALQGGDGRRSVLCAVRCHHESARGGRNLGRVVTDPGTGTGAPQ